MIYLDNSATTKPCREAVEAMTLALTEGWANPSALYGFGFDAAKEALGLVQSNVTIFGIKALCLLAPALFSLGSYLAFRFLWNITPELKVRMTEHLKND